MYAKGKRKKGKGKKGGEGGGILLYGVHVLFSSTIDNNANIYAFTLSRFHAFTILHKLFILKTIIQ